MLQEELIVVPGDVIHVDDSEDGSSGFLRGHGTYVLNENKLVASVAGVVERVNKLISVRLLKSRLEHTSSCWKRNEIQSNTLCNSKARLEIYEYTQKKV